MTKSNALFAAALAACIALLSVTATTAKGFKTPENAINAYVTGIAAGDFDKVLAATAIDEMSQNFDFVAYVDRLQSLTVAAPAPSTNPLYVAINKAAYTETIATQVQFLTYGLLSTSPVLEGRSVQMDGDGAADLQSEFDLSRLAGLTVSKIRPPVPSVTSDERYLTNSASQARTLGADELVERIALVTLDDRSYLIGFTIVRYGETWGISSQVSALAGTTVIGTPIPITPEDYDASFQ